MEGKGRGEGIVGCWIGRRGEGRGVPLRNLRGGRSLSGMKSAEVSVPAPRIDTQTHLFHSSRITNSSNRQILHPSTIHKIHSRFRLDIVIRKSELRLKSAVPKFRVANTHKIRDIPQLKPQSLNLRKQIIAFLTHQLIRLPPRLLPKPSRLERRTRRIPDKSHRFAEFFE
jgi:hypothetical protein